MSQILTGLANYGPIGIILLAFLLLFFKLFNRLFNNLLAQQAKSDTFMSNCLSAMHEMRLSCIQCRNDTVNAAHDAHRATADKILTALKEEADRIIGDNRRDNDLSRPHENTPPPIRPGYPLPSAPGGRAR